MFHVNRIDPDQIKQTDVFYQTQQMRIIDTSSQLTPCLENDAIEGISFAGFYK